MLSLLFPFVDVRNHFHIDHIFPKSKFTKPKLRKAGIPDNDIDEFLEMVNGLPTFSYWKELRILRSSRPCQPTGSKPHMQVSQAE